MYNKDKNTTYYGLLDVKENKVLYNIESDEEVTFIPDSNGQMIAITSTSIYKVCTVKEDNDCADTSSCANIMLDPDGNKCQSGCDTGKILTVPEGICIDKNLCDLNIYVLNEDETECGLCNDFYPNGAKYRLINSPGCLENMPSNGLDYWVDGVSGTGTFTMSSNATWNPEDCRGNNGLPVGWTVTTVTPQ